MESVNELRKYCEDRDAWLVLTAYKLNELADAIEAEVAERYVALPTDANGEVIHIGDVIAYKDNTLPKEVVALVPPSVVMVEDGPRYADMCRHYHAPTVESTLREMLAEIGEGGVYAEDVLLAKYAPKFRLVGDGE